MFQAYYGGEARCDAEVGEEYDPTELVCGACSDVSRAQMCPKHGTDFLEYKCRYCCSVAVFFCFGTTHFCNACHDDFQRVTNIPRLELPSCPAGMFSVLSSLCYQDLGWSYCCRQIWLFIKCQEENLTLLGLFEEWLSVWGVHILILERGMPFFTNKRTKSCLPTNKVINRLTIQVHSYFSVITETVTFHLNIFFVLRCLTYLFFCLVANRRAATSFFMSVHLSIKTM